MAMDCREFLKLHSEFLDERLARSDADRCEAHAATCASCARYDRVVRRGQELLRRLPATPVSPDFRTRLEQRVLQGRDEVFAEHAASTGAVVSLAIAGLLALAAWGPMLRSSDGGPELVLETAPAYEVPAVDPLMLPAPDWWQAPVAGSAFGGNMRPAERLELAFPGPYNPLIVMPPVVDARRGVGALPARLTALE